METNAVLVERMKANDPDAFRELYERHRQGVARICRRVLKDLDMVDDAVQETFFRVHKKIGSFRGDARFDTWIKRIAINVSLGELRRHHHRREISSEAIDFAPQFGRHDQDLEHSSEWREVGEALKKISPKHRQMVYLRAVGYRNPEIAMMLGCNINCCKSRYHMAIISLRRVLARSAAFRT